MKFQNPFRETTDTVRISIDVPREMHCVLRSTYPHTGFIKAFLSQTFANLANECKRKNWLFSDAKKFEEHVNQTTPGLFND